MHMQMQAPQRVCSGMAGTPRASKMVTFRHPGPLNKQHDVLSHRTSARAVGERGAAPPPDVSFSALKVAGNDDGKKEIKLTTGLHRAPLSGGVKVATARHELPSPAVAVRNLLENARYGHLCTMMSGMHHRRAGYPFGTLVDFAVDGEGKPFFCLSPLAIHSRNLLEESKSSLVVQMPGWTGLANARVTIFGDIVQLPQDMQDRAQEIFFAKHANERKERWVSGNFVYFVMERITDIYFVGGFGTVQWIEPSQYLSSAPDSIVLNQPQRTLAVLNDMFAEDFKAMLRVTASDEIHELMFISIDGMGVDMRIRIGPEYSVERVSFGERVNDEIGAISRVRAVLQAVGLGGKK
ncbi:hypothetical protein DUNSADRAFT_14265 [Dunaliella salina]|uniref:CREG-like beta-barrel domain-containing protein n=1 Tax=Dunaliella salina TaxID=3046 RepID=A0ABQ7G7P9_DUNSA|nr:hypothetical protein DUNSADRAFT_14265 [Dunaliella salina]|eukprot:KAF5830618.1 hypothetical protein DUNSADRAFT_14265 [Dunaliella salina]